MQLEIWVKVYPGERVSWIIPSNDDEIANESQIQDFVPGTHKILKFVLCL